MTALAFLSFHPFCPTRSSFPLFLVCFLFGIFYFFLLVVFQGTNRFVMTEMLRSLGIRCEQAVNGDEALYLILPHPNDYALVVCLSVE